MKTGRPYDIDLYVRELIRNVNVMSVVLFLALDVFSYSFKRLMFYLKKCLEKGLGWARPGVVA